MVEKDGQVEELGSLVQVKEKDEEQRPFEVDGKEIFANRSKQAKPKAGETALNQVAGGSGGKDECQVRLKGRERDYWMGTEIGML